MPITSTYPATVDAFPRPTSGVSLQSDPNEAELANAHSTAIETLEGLVGAAAGTPGSHAARIAALEAGGTQVIDVRDMGLTEGSGASASTNSFNFGFNAATGPAIYYFPSGRWNNTGLLITQSNQSIKGAGAGATTLYYQGSAAAPDNWCVEFLGPADDVSSGRIYHNGLSDLSIDNHGSQSNNNAIGLKIRNVTHLRVERVAFNTWRGSAVEASNFADSSFTWVEFDFCGSANDGNLAVINFNGTQTSWAVDQIRFAFCRWENNGDRIFDFRQGNGNLVNKIQCVQCKFENSVTTGNGIGGTGATMSQFYLDTCHWVTFVQCEFTLQELRSAHAIIDTCFRLIGEVFLTMTDCWFNFSKATKPFTNLFLTDSATAHLITLSNVWINVTNAAAFQTDVINVSAAGSPFVVVCTKGCGWTPALGSAKGAGDWINGSQRGAAAVFTNGVSA